MADLTPEQRIAALRAKRAADPEPATPEPATPGVRRHRLPRPSATRAAAAGASLVSFAAMVVAMGPLTVTAEQPASEPGPSANDGTEPTEAPPAGSSVVIEVIPNYVGADGLPLALTDGSTAPDIAVHGSSTTIAGSGSAEQAAVDQVTTASPAIQSQAAPPTTASVAAAPITAAPVAAAPVTAPAATAAPTTAPPVTAAPTTAPPPPPKSDASG